MLDRTPLYAESGGQENDVGLIVADGLELEVNFSWTSGLSAKVLKGGAGGKPDIAQDDGTDPLATIDALREVTRVIEQTVSH
ncbi:MAG TPA: alanine--tRNA ligase-related protein [Pseudonocardiaceae bacterium]|nr:alanine--tRNA ligase-related protein [Pseudonocardiaceae bacterium]